MRSPNGEGSEESERVVDAVIEENLVEGVAAAAAAVVVEEVEEKEALLE